VAGHRESNLEQRDTIEYRHLGTLSNLSVIVRHAFESCAIQLPQLCNMKSSRLSVVRLPSSHAEVPA
jgi:hypothetical protein